MKCLYLNARSCNNKVTEINDLIIEKNADLVFITETWFKDKDNTTISNLLPYGFEIIYKNRQSRSGGGVAIIYRSTLDIVKCDILNDFSTFESCYLKIKSHCLKNCFFACIYRPPKSKKNTASFSDFLNEFNSFAENLHNEENILVLGDFNVHFENSIDTNVLAFKTLIYEHDLIQTINVPIQYYPRY